ncbi:MAG: polysulfide reductase NrfD [Armatimonadetes bacterium]|nr:polysulfide reductase NrfD [Armatimonadota bacterium]
MPGETGAPSYYDLSMLKPPVWTPEVGVYFFLGGVSGGAYMLARLAERIGGDEYRSLTRAGTAVALAAALPCAPLLIVDLGDPKRFHHMLRVWKPHSPMSLGSWALTAYSAAAALAGLREWVRARQSDAPLSGAARVADGAAAVVADAGVPLGLLVAGYTGVLLSTTAVPIWGRNPWLGALFSAGAVGSGASAVRLALAGVGDDSQGAAGEALTKVEGAARAAEAVMLGGFLAAAGEFAAPLTTGPEAKRFWGGAVAAGLAVPTILEGLPVSKRVHKRLGLAASAAALLGAFALRASIVGAGRPSASDPEAARRASRAKPEDLRESTGVA